MKTALASTIVALTLLTACDSGQQSTTTERVIPTRTSAPAPEAKPVEPIAEVPAQPSPPPAAVEPPEPIAEAAKPTTPPKAVSANKGADPARGIKPESPTAKAPDISIQYAARDGNIEAVKQHIAAGTDLEPKEWDWTPLHIAALNGRKEIAELLIAEGANVNPKDDGDETPLDFAIKGKHTKIADLLRKHGGKRGYELKAEGK